MGRYPQYTDRETSRECLEKSQTSPEICYAYTATKTCDHHSAFIPGVFDKTKRDDGIYDCPGKYLDATGASFTCAEDCTNSNSDVLKYEARKLCLTNDNYASYSFFIWQNNGQKSLVTAEECEAMEGWHAYLARHECLKIEHASNGAFVRRTDDISSCP